MSTPNLQALLAQADKQRNFPAGTMASLVKQETGGQQRFIDKPDDFHYKVGPNGEKPKSTARGLGGILEATARDPGYGVAPLKDWSAPEQIRFMADYLDARSKNAGSLHAGLAGYGEGDKYARQVAKRRDGTSPPLVSQIPQMAQAVPALQEAVPVSVQIAAAPQQVSVQPAPVQQMVRPGPEPRMLAQQAEPALPDWNAFRQAMPLTMQPQDLNYGPAKVQMAAIQPGFGRFKAFGARG